jgi:hypothetical protein
MFFAKKGECTISQLKYQKLYFKIINNAKFKNRSINEEEYYEKHHIIPSSFNLPNFNKDYKNNMVLLTAKEHYICHLLLTKFCIGVYRYKMMYAFDFMNSSNTNQRRINKTNSILYQLNKESLKDIPRGKTFGIDNGSFDTIWVSCIQSKIAKKIPKVFLEDYLKIGYIKGRVTDFNKYLAKLQNKEKRLEDKLNNYYLIKTKFKFYNINGWKKTKSKFKLDYTQQNLIRKFKAYKFR